MIDGGEGHGGDRGGGGKERKVGDEEGERVLLGVWKDGIGDGERMKGTEVGERNKCMVEKDMVKVEEEKKC